MNFFTNQFYLQRERLFLWAPVIFACGIGLYFALSFEPQFRVIGGSLILLAGLAAYTIRRFESYGYRIFMLALLIFCAGLAAAQFRVHMVHTPLLAKEIGPITVTARVLEVESLESGDDKRLLLGDVVIEDVAPEDTPRKIRLRLRRDPGLLVGQRVELLAQLMPLSPPSIPGGFDFQRHFYFQGIGAVGFVYKFIRVVEEPQPGWLSIEPLRQSILHSIERSLSPPQSGIVSALMINETSAIAEADHEAMRVSGLAHMLSISGMHVVIVAGGVFFAVRLLMAFAGLALRHPIKKYAAVLGFCAAFFYMLLAGSNFPVQRSVLMTGVVFLAIIFDRFPFSLRLVAFSALVVLAIAPDALLSPSFQMSFAAVTALIWSYETLRGRFAGFLEGGGWIRKAVLYVGGIATTLATAPFGIYHFHTFGVYSIPANLMGVPVLSFIVMPAGVLALMAMPLGLEYWPLQVMGWGAGFILEIAYWASGLPMSSIKLGMIPFLSFVYIVAAALWGMLVIGWLRLLALAPLSLAVLMWTQARLPDVLIAADHELAGVVLEDGTFAVSSKRREKFTTEIWEGALGLEKGSAVDWRAASVPCDEQGCRIEKRGVKLAFSARPDALADDCAWADVVIAEYKMEAPCKAHITIDRSALYRLGSHAIWTSSPPRFEAAGSFRGQRPWVGRGN